MICSHCGKELKDGTPVCVYCGTLLSQTPAPVQESNDAPAPVQGQNDAAKTVLKSQSSNTSTSKILSIVFAVLAFVFDFGFSFLEAYPRFILIFPIGFTIFSIVLAVNDIIHSRIRKQPLSCLSLIGLGISIAVAAQLVCMLLLNTVYDIVWSLL